MADEPYVRKLRRRVPWRRDEHIEIHRQPPPGVPPPPMRLVPRTPGAGPLLVGNRTSWRADLYHRTLVMGWWTFLLIGVASYLGLNLLFAGLYMLDAHGIGHARPGVFADAFFFSVQTMATIGYGVLTPDTTYANLVVLAETMVALVFVTIATGATFARFSRPTARVRFSRVVTVAPFNGVPTLSARMANARRNQILEATVSLTLLRNERSSEGQPMRRFYDLALARGHTPIFSLSFTAMHSIGADSPLFGATRESLLAEQAELLVTVTGLDDTMAQTIHARTSYSAEEIMFGYRYADMFGYTQTGQVVLDLDRFHEVRPI